MEEINRRSAITLGILTASATLANLAAAQTGDGIAAKDTSVGPGVVLREYGQERSIIPGFGTVKLRDIIVQPGATTKENNEMMNAMVCHVTEGELEVVQDGKTIVARKNYVWSCNKGTKEHVINKGNAVAVMRIIDLIA
jgi:quercetin dioxygenase-like cupin family protein